MRRHCAMALLICVGAGIWLASARNEVEGQDKKPEPPKAGPEHEILKRLAGEWECDFEAIMEPGKPAVKSKGSMTGHMIGGFWVTVTMKGEVMGMPYHGQGVFGYDSRKKKKYIGTWSDSMSDFLWQYEGKADGDKLIFDSEGPSPTDPDKLIKFRDTWELKRKDQIVLTGEMEGPDGKLFAGMKSVCTRKK